MKPWTKPTSTAPLESSGRPSATLAQPRKPQPRGPASSRLVACICSTIDRIEQIERALMAPGGTLRRRPHRRSRGIICTAATFPPVAGFGRAHQDASVLDAGRGGVLPRPRIGVRAARLVALNGPTLPLVRFPPVFE